MSKRVGACRRGPGDVELRQGHIQEGWGTSKCVEAHVQSAGCVSGMLGAWLGHGAREGCVGHVWGGSGVSETWGPIMGGRGSTSGTVGGCLTWGHGVGMVEGACACGGGWLHAWGTGGLGAWLRDMADMWGASNGTGQVQKRLGHVKG